MSNSSVPCLQCGYPTTGALGVPDICPLCAADNLKGGPMICKKCKKTCIPIGATLRGVQLVGCLSCGVVYAPTLPGSSMSRSTSLPVKIVKKPVRITKKVVVKKTKVAVKGKNGKTQNHKKRLQTPKKQSK